MVFWLAVLIGALFAWNAVRLGFYASWILFFNLLLAVYAAIFLAPSVIESVPAATAIPGYGYALTVLSIAIAALFFTYGTCYACLSGRFCIEFPKFFDTIVAGFFGFLTGFLVLSFLTLVFSLTPPAQLDSMKGLGLDSQSQQTNVAYVCWWCDRLHGFVSPFGNETTGRQSVDALLAMASPKSSDEAPTEAVADGPPPPEAPMAPGISSSGQTAVGGSPAGGTETRRPSETATAGAAESSAGLVADQASGGAASSRQGFETLEEELVRRHVTIRSPEALSAAVNRKDVQIIEVATTCTADKFDAAQTALLQKWVSQGGVLWASNDVLSLMGVQTSTLKPSGNGLACVVSDAPEVAPIVSLCKKVSLLASAGGKARIVSSKQLLPLLLLERGGANAADRVCWSLVPYGRGWITDPKPVNMKQDDGDQFWQDFCRFCLGKETISVPGEPGEPVGPSAAASATPSASGASAESLTGVWKTPGGATFRVHDVGKTMMIDLVTSDTLQTFSGNLTRREDGSLAGAVDVVFLADSTKKAFQVDVTVTVVDGRNLRLRCADWPVWTGRGKYMGNKTVVNETWTRSDETTKTPSIRHTRPLVVPPSW